MNQLLKKYFVRYFAVNNILQLVNPIFEHYNATEQITENLNSL